MCEQEFVRDNVGWTGESESGSPEWADKERTL